MSTKNEIPFTCDSCVKYSVANSRENENSSKLNSVSCEMRCLFL